MIDTDKYTELTIDDWYNLKAHQWEEVMHSYCNLVRVNESLRFELDGKHEDGLKWIEKCEELDTEVKRWHKVRDYILEKASYPTVNKLHLKDLLNFMQEVIE